MRYFLVFVAFAPLTATAATTRPTTRVAIFQRRVTTTQSVRVLREEMPVPNEAKDGQPPPKHIYRISCVVQCTQPRAEKEYAVEYSGDWGDYNFLVYDALLAGDQVVLACRDGGSVWCSVISPPKDGASTPLITSPARVEIAGVSAFHNGITRVVIEGSPANHNLVLHLWSHKVEVWRYKYVKSTDANGLDWERDPTFPPPRPLDINPAARRQATTSPTTNPS